MAATIDRTAPRAARRRTPCVAVSAALSHISPHGCTIATPALKLRGGHYVSLEGLEEIGAEVWWTDETESCIQFDSALDNEQVTYLLARSAAGQPVRLHAY